MTMTTRRKVLVIDKHVWGGLTDSYMWCRYAKEFAEVTYVGLTSEMSVPKLKGMKFRLCRYGKSKITRIFGVLGFMVTALFSAMTFKGSIIVVNYDGCLMLKKFLPWKKIHLDVRTLSVSPNPERRKKENKRIIKAAQRFNTVSVISAGVKKEMGIDKATILPLGSDIISTEKKRYDKRLNLLYVGTFRGRDIEKTIYGIKQFLEQNPVPLHYDIVGGGSEEDAKKITQAIEHTGLNKQIKYHGIIPRTELKPYFDKANIGICYVPVTDYYNNQPPTKLFEYALSGLYVLATATASNKEVITPSNGVIIEDSPEGIAAGLKQVMLMQERINERELRNSLEGYSWDNIVNTTFRKIIG